MKMVIEIIYLVLIMDTSVHLSFSQEQLCSFSVFNEIIKSFTLSQVTSTFKIDLKVFHIDIGTYFAGIFEGIYFSFRSWLCSCKASLSLMSHS